MIRVVASVFVILATAFAQAETEKVVKHYQWEPTPPEKEGEESKQRFPEVKNLDGFTVPLYKRYDRDQLPVELLQRRMQTRNISLAGWRGERVHAQVLAFSSETMKQLRAKLSEFKSPESVSLPGSIGKCRFVRYVLADGKLTGDILDNAKEIDAAAGTTRPVWLSVDIPTDALPGIYEATMEVRAADREPLEFPIRLKVQKQKLPPPSEWPFHLDIWQQPWAVARLHQVEPWSEAHWVIMREILTMLGDAGVKCITTSINHKPWNQPAYDAFGGMIEWRRHPDGKWSFDYTLFDRYVDLAMECGIKKQINCYSMLPWGNLYYYIDVATGDRKQIKVEPGTPEYETFWTPFLNDFTKHLKVKGWLDKTCIATDELDLANMVKFIKLLKKAAPQLKIALSANTKLETIEADVYDYCFLIKFVEQNDRAWFEKRRKAGRVTTYYVCCHPQRPNTFTNSPPAESTWLGWYSRAQELDGFLRWAFVHWNKEPMINTDFGHWPTGDAFLIYPGPRSSVRWELLRDGIEDFEKLRIIEPKLSAEQKSQLQAIYDRFHYSDLESPAVLTHTVLKAKSLLERFSE